MKKYNTIVVVVLLSNVLTALGQGPSTAQLQQWNEAHFPTHVEQFLHYLSLPNVSSDAEGIATNVNYIAQQLQAANLEVSKIDFRGVPYLYAEKTVVGTAPTVLFYVQLDAQPVAPTAWAQKNPFVPVIKRKKDDDNANVFLFFFLSYPCSEFPNLDLNEVSDSEITCCPVLELNFYIYIYNINELQVL